MEHLLWQGTDAPAAEDLAAVDRGLDLSNHAAADLGAVRPLACFARSADGQLIGGAVARTWGRCCELQQLWVDENQRRHGIGRKLVQMVEVEAQRRGCTIIYLETFSFQAPSLYRSLGYEPVCQFEGFDQEIIKYIMSKTLGP